MSRPVTQKQLRSVLGLFGYFRDYLANYAELAKPLTDLTLKRVPQISEKKFFPGAISL